MSRIIQAEARITAKDATGGVFAQIGAKLKGLEGVSRGVNSRLVAASQSVAGQIAAIAGPVALAAGAAKSVAVFANLERRMSRIGITADASGAAIKAATADVQKLAFEAALPTEQVAAALDSLVSQGKSLPEAMALLPSVVKTAQAAGAETKDIATSAGAIGDQMKITADRMQGAFDILVAAGKAGKFELKDMARYLPALAPLAASVGMRGEEGLRRLAATAQVVRNQTGTAEEAAASLQNIFAKMESEETTKRFAKFGIDLRKEMAKARLEGKDLLTVFADLSEKALKGDLSKVPQLFSDMEFARGMRALLSQKGAVDALVASLRNVDGSAMKDFNRIVTDTRGNLDKAKEAFDQLATRVGEGLSPAALAVLNPLNAALKNSQELGNGPTVDPLNLPAPGEVQGNGSAGSSRAAGIRAERGSPVNPMGGMATGRAAERSVPDDEMRKALPLADTSIVYYRSRAGAAGTMTPHQSIVEQERLEKVLREREDVDARLARLPPSRQAEAKAQWDSEGLKIAERIERLERARSGGAAPTPAEVDARYRSLRGDREPVKIEGDVKTQVEVKVTVEEGFVARIIRQTTEAIGIRAAPSNGPGTTGTTMPEASAPNRGMGHQ